MPDLRAVGDGHITQHSQVDHVDDNANEGSASRESTSGGPGSSQQAPGVLSDLATKEKRTARQKELMAQFKERRADVDRKLQERIEGDKAKGAEIQSAGEEGDRTSLDALRRAENLADQGNIEMGSAIATQLAEHRRVVSENAFTRPQNEASELDDDAKAAIAAKAAARESALRSIYSLEGDAQAQRRREARGRIDQLNPPVSSTEEAAALIEALSELYKKGRIDLPTCNAYHAALQRPGRLRLSDPDVVGRLTTLLTQTAGQGNRVVVEEIELFAARENTRARADARRAADAYLSGLPRRNDFRTAMNAGARSAAASFLGQQTALPTEVSGRILGFVPDAEPVVNVGAGGPREWTLPTNLMPWLALTANEPPAREAAIAARLRSLRVGQEGGAAERTQPLRADEAAQILGGLIESVAPDMRGHVRESISNTERRAEQPIGNPGHITAEQEEIAQRLDRLNELIETVPPQMRGELRELISDMQRRDEQPTRNRGRITMAQVLNAQVPRFATPLRPAAGLDALRGAGRQADMASLQERVAAARRRGADGRDNVDAPGQTRRLETADTQLTIGGIGGLDTNSDSRDFMRSVGARFNAAMAAALDGPPPRAEGPQSDDQDQGARRT